jgi:hypothetical protein
MKSSTDRTVRVLYGHCTGLYGRVQFFYFRGFWVLTQWLATLVPVGQVFQDKRPIFPCHTIFTRVSHGTYTGLHGFFLGGRTGAILKAPRLGSDRTGKASEKSCVSAQDGGQVEKTATCRKRGDHCRGLPHHELAA